MEEDRDYSKPVQKSKKKVILFILFVLFNIAVIAYTAYKEFSKKHPPALSIHFDFINIVFLILAFGCIFVSIGAEAIKYLMMMRALKVKRSVRCAVQTAIIGKYYDNLTPSGAGGQPSQIWFMHRNGYDSGSSAAMPLSSFFTMQLSFVILAVFFFLVNSKAMDAQPGIKVTAWIGLIFYIAFPLMILISVISHKTAAKIVNFFVTLLGKIHIFKNPEKTKEGVVKTLTEYAEGVRTIAKERFLLPKLFLCSFVYQLAISSIPYFVLLAFGSHLPYIEVLTMTLYIYAAITFIPTPGNSGAAEASFYLVFNHIKEAGGVFWAMLCWRFICYYCFIFLGLGVYAYNSIADRKKNKAVTEGQNE